MEKQIETVYVPTDEATKKFLGYLGENGINEVQAYLYTPEEHAVVQGYREVIYGMLKTMADRSLGMEQSFVKSLNIAMSALSKAEDKGDNGWISVEDRLPLTNKNVLIFSNDRGIGEATKGRRDIDGRYFTVCGMQLFEVTHWQPLPPKP